MPQKFLGRIRVQKELPVVGRLSWGILGFVRMSSLGIVMELR